ncbi:hypothetical protein F4V91_07530 [Neorhizobium galegae]|uniref:Uncharacterized protein n=1 Tax=Neorhizobium galegae TaxID=399 RepID=A0A6A1TPF1_NEOGA|nr:hypothetical protein [Neorhizobium galegae]KAB1086298.1 hypothetical protein F4V91_07530 [Neorhizobium galegae]
MPDIVIIGIFQSISSKRAISMGSIQIVETIGLSRISLNENFQALRCLKNYMPLQDPVRKIAQQAGVRPIDFGIYVERRRSWD